MIKNFVRKIKEKDKTYIWIWFLFFSIITLCYVQFMNQYVHHDHIHLARCRIFQEFPNWESFIPSFSAGRCGAVLLLYINYVLNIFKISHFQYDFVYKILGNILFAISATLLYKMFCRFFTEKQHKFLLGAWIIFCFVNPFMVEAYQYDGFEFSIGILLAVLAAQKLTERKRVQGFLLAFLATSIYQTNLMIIVIISFSYIMIENLRQNRFNIKKLIFEFLEAGVLSALAALLVIFVHKIFALTGGTIYYNRMAKKSDNYIELLSAIFRSIVGIYWQMFTLFPKRFVPLLVMVLWGTCIYIFIKKKQILKAGMFTIFTGGLFVTPFMYMVAMNGTWAAQRMLFSIFFAISMFGISVFTIVKSRKKTEYLVYVISVIFLFVNYYCTQTCITDVYMGQALDYSEAVCIESEIESYEEDTGITVNKVSWRLSTDFNYVHPLLHFQNDNLSTHRIYDSVGGELFNYVNGTDYEILRMTDEEYEKYFNNKSWEVFNPSEQLYFEGDTVYWAVY